MDDKAKVILKLFSRFLDKQGCGEGEFEFDADGTSYNDRFWCSGTRSRVSSPVPIDGFLEKIIEPLMVDNVYSDELEEDGYVVSYLIKITSDNKLDVYAEAEYYTVGEEEFSTMKITDEDLAGLPKDKGRMYVQFDGGGDSGYIEDELYLDEGKETFNIPPTLMDKLYNLLSENSGWEIDEGSQGTFYIDPEEMLITLEFQWNIRDTFQEKLLSIDFGE
jgi:hypothetical protein